MKKLTNQHGDVLFYKVDKLPDNLKPVSKVNGRTVVMDGEHMHIKQTKMTMFIKKKKPF